MGLFNPLDFVGILVKFQLAIIFICTGYPFFLKTNFKSVDNVYIYIYFFESS